jgi:hypothetical protein
MIVKCDCFCSSYDCPRDDSDAVWCESHGDKLKARALGGHVKRQLSAAVNQVNVEKRSEIQATQDYQKRTAEIENRIASVDSQAASCADSCEALVNYCVNVRSNPLHEDLGGILTTKQSFHRSEGDCRGDVCGATRNDCKDCADFAKTCITAIVDS